MPLEAITEGVWGATGTVSPGPGAVMDTRATIVRLPDESLLIHSPIDFEPAMLAEIRDLGEVSYLVSPNLFHHFFLSKAKQRWPEATVCAPAGLTDKVKGLEVDEEISPQESWLDCFSVHPVLGMPKFGEFVFFHQPSNTLITTDLVFNHPQGRTVFARLFFRIFGTYGKFAVSRLFKTMIKDREACRRSVENLYDLPFNRVVMAHGEVLSENAKQRFVETTKAAL